MDVSLEVDLEYTNVHVNAALAWILALKELPTELNNVTSDSRPFLNVAEDLLVSRILLTYFRFAPVVVESGGETKKYIDYPDSITEWMFQAIGITEDSGMCIAEALDVKSYRPFFIQLHLPYKAVRLEYIDVKATIFSYGLPVDGNRTANVYVEGVDGLCISSEPNRPSPKISVILPPNSAQTVTFPMTPMKDGIFPIKVSAMVTEGGLPMVDVVEKKLYVVNEGIEVKIPIQVCLDPNKDMEDCKNVPVARVLTDEFFHGAVAERILTVDLSLPEDSISGTGAATGYVQSNIMDNIVTTILEGVDSLFGLPWGCGEQTIATTSPNVYAMMYLKQTKQITKEIEEKGNYNIRFGVNREISQFRHSDGSFSCCLKVPTSTWLTAFVAKVFCQAKTVVDDALNTIEDIEVTINWLINHVQTNGSFVENMPVGWRFMVGRMNETTHSLTSFVLVSLLECPIRTQAVNNTIQKSKTFLENIDRNVLKNDPYQLALTTYALAMANSGQKWAFKTLLEEVAHKEGKDMYWGKSGGQRASSESVETTAYALLAMLQFDDLGTSARIVRWLTAQRSAKGIFRTTQDTAVGLQALSTYSIRTYSPDVNLQISLFGGGKLEELSITKENAIVQKIAKNLPVERGDNKLIVRVKGSGAGRMTIDLRYNRPAKDDEICPFDVTDVEVEEIQQNPNDVNVNIANIRNCDVCGKCDEPDQPINDAVAFDIPDIPDIENVGNDFGRRKRQAEQQPEANTLKCIRFSVSSKSENKEYGMSIVEFGLETDVEVMKEDLDKLKAEDKNIDMYELPSNGKGFVVFYLLKITSSKTKFTFRLKNNYEGDASTRQPSYVKVYDYYNPDQHCTKLYGTGPNRANGISYRCDEDNKQCQCLQSLCAIAVDDEILRLYPKGRPAQKLAMYTCNPEKANYAVFVEIETVTYVPGKEEIVAKGRILRSIHTGSQTLVKDDEMVLFWKMSCDPTILEEGKRYYIIGKDGFKLGDSKAFRYPLMGTTIIIKNLEDRKIKSVMDVYTNIMVDKGCQN